MISKELLSKVFGIEILGCKPIEQYVSYIFDANVETRNGNISVFELAHLCKQWTVKNSGWTLQSYTNERGVGICRIRVGDGQEINKLIGTSEVESIFKATEWVYAELKNKGKLK